MHNHKTNRNKSYNRYMLVNKLEFRVVSYTILTLCVLILMLLPFSVYKSNMPKTDNVLFVELYPVDLPEAGVVKCETQYILLPVAGVAAVDLISPDCFISEINYDANEKLKLDYGYEVRTADIDMVDFNMIKERKRKQKQRANNPSVYLAELGDTIELTDDFLSLCAMVHYEAGEGASVESKAYVGNVAMNRLQDTSKWGYSNLHDVLYAPNQFSVVHKQKFKSMKEKLKTKNWDDYMKSSVVAAHLAYTNSDLYDIPKDVQYFYGSPNKTTWGKHTFCFTYGGNSFFK